MCLEWNTGELFNHGHIAVHESWETFHQAEPGPKPLRAMETAHPQAAEVSR